MYDDHCAGKKHIKREKEAKVYSCDICGVFCITADEQKEHFESPLHEESVRVQEYLASQQEFGDDEEGDGEYLNDDELSDIKLTGKSKDLYKMCELCHVRTNSRSMWEAVSDLLLKNR